MVWEKSWNAATLMSAPGQEIGAESLQIVPAPVGITVSVRMIDSAKAAQYGGRIRQARRRMNVRYRRSRLRVAAIPSEKPETTMNSTTDRSPSSRRS
jgi:hypothetical protein